MRFAATAALVFLAVAVLASGVLPQAGFAQRTAPSVPGATAGLITVAAPSGDHRQQLIVIDPETRGLAVYHVDTASGEVSLKSVRNIYYDLKITEYNGTSPLPREIRSLLEPN